MQIYWFKFSFRLNYKNFFFYLFIKLLLMKRQRWMQQGDTCRTGKRTRWERCGGCTAPGSCQRTTPKPGEPTERFPSPCCQYPAIDWSKPGSKVATMLCKILRPHSWIILLTLEDPANISEGSILITPTKLKYRILYCSNLQNNLKVLLK